MYIKKGSQLLILSIMTFTLFSASDTYRDDSEINKKRAILVSIDALNEEILKRTLTAEQVPALFEVFEYGACADFAISAFPSLTAPSHSAIWTGSYGDVSGIAGNSQHPYPRENFTVLETRSGFSYEPLKAESIWISAARSGEKVAAHHATQAPGVPGYSPQTGEPSDSLKSRRDEAEQLLSDTLIKAFNGYNRMITPNAVLTGDDVTWIDSAIWPDLENLETNVEPKSFRWENDVGKFYGLIFGEEIYNKILISDEPSIENSISAVAIEAEISPIADRELAPHFSKSLRIPVDNGTVYLRVRLFQLNEDGSDFMLFHPALQVIESNKAAHRDSYDNAVRGWIGNSSVGLYRQGVFGNTYPDGGDGLAEARYFETAELITRQFMRGSEWLWREHDLKLMLDYFPLSDAIDHTILGFLEDSYPGYDEELASKISDFRARVWGLTDLRIRHLMDLTEEVDATLFVTGDHGMRTSWNVFHPNKALEEAGLLFRNSEGEVDLTRTKAYSPNGYWITINTVDWKNGIVSFEQKMEIVTLVKEALSEVQKTDGKEVVTDFYTPENNPEMGLGGPSGGDIYWEVSDGIRNSSAFGEDVVVENTALRTGHGFPSHQPDMYTVFCAKGVDFNTNRVAGIKLIDIAPTVSEYLGIHKPYDARGNSVLMNLLDN